jgi:hypothetical protein
MADAVIGGLILLTWAIVLIRMSVQDLVTVLRRNEKKLSESWTPDKS